MGANSPTSPTSLLIYVLPIAIPPRSWAASKSMAWLTVRADASGVLTAAGLVTVSATAPSPVQNGALWYDLVGGQLYTWVNDGTFEPVGDRRQPEHRRRLSAARRRRC